MSCRVCKPQDASQSFPHSINKNLQNTSIVNLTTLFCFYMPVTDGVLASDFCVCLFVTIVQEKAIKVSADTLDLCQHK